MRPTPEIHKLILPADAENPANHVRLTMLLHSYLCCMKILMVCLGNICRSPLAEGILQDKAFSAGLTWNIESAGTNSYHTGEPPHSLSQKVAKLNGIDISQQRARKFAATDFEVYDKIYALADDVLEEIKRIAGTKFDSAKAGLLMNELYPGKNMDVPDPWYGPEPGYHEAYKLIDKACEAIIEKAINKPGQQLHVKIVTSKTEAPAASLNLK